MADGGEKLPLSVAELSGLYILPGQSTLLHSLARFAVENNAKSKALGDQLQIPHQLNMADLWSLQCCYTQIN